jgi:hypothetical protein
MKARNRKGAKGAKGRKGLARRASPGEHPVEGAR